MTNLTNKFVTFTATRATTINESFNILFRRRCTNTVPYTLQKEKKIHPYRKLHPWKSLNNFSEDLLKNLVYNLDGLVVLNKPYGISKCRVTASPSNEKKYTAHFLPNAVDYCLEDSLPHIAKELNYEKLRILKAPERFMTGATILAGTANAEAAVLKSLHQIKIKCPLYRTFWIITTMIPKELKGEQQMAMKLATKPGHSDKKAVIYHTWSKADFKKRGAKPLTVKFKVLSNSTMNLSSLIEIQPSTLHWHAIRLFASTVLFSPVLGDNYHGTCIKNVMGTWFPVDPFDQVTDLLPPLNPDLLKLLNLTKAKQEIIPAHVHLRSLRLPSYFGKKKDFVIEAPLIPPFDWTSEQLMFKYLMKEKVEVVQPNIQKDAYNNSTNLLTASV